jgi:hypothetical protein
LRKGQILRLTDIDGGANVSMMMLNPHEKSERLNLPDTLKGQHTARLTAALFLLRYGAAFWPGLLPTAAAGTTRSGYSTPTRRVKIWRGRYQELRNGFTATASITCWLKWAMGSGPGRPADGG